MADNNIRKWNKSQSSFRHRSTKNDSPPKTSINILAHIPSISMPIDVDEAGSLSRSPSLDQVSRDDSQKLLSPSIMPRIHLLSTSQRRKKFMQRTTTLSHEYHQSSHDEDNSNMSPHILEDIEHLSLSSRSSSNSESIPKLNRPPTLPDGSPPSPHLLQPPDVLKSNIFLLERPPHKQVNASLNFYQKLNKLTKKTTYYIMLRPKNHLALYILVTGKNFLF
uniref:PH domain-containing protein n=1 Tax=Parastrongyloides trichosuri TaxID=131310 RepID=A0A0N4ZQQ2_PARTI